MSIPASFHLTDALYGLAVGTVATGAGISYLYWWTHRAGPDRATAQVRAVPVVLAATAGVVAMYLARAVRSGLVQDIATGPAIAVGVVGCIGGLGWAWLARRLAPAWIAVVVLLSAAGVWAAVPDTETAVAVMAAWLPFAGWAAVCGRIAPDAPAPFALPLMLAWSAMAIVLAWAAAWGADADEASLPGALACFGIALVVPWVVATARGGVRVTWLVPIQLVAVIVAARWAANASSTGGGLARSVGLLAVLSAVVAVSCRSSVPAHLPPSDQPERPR